MTNKPLRTHQPNSETVISGISGMQMFLSYLYVSHTGSKRVLHPGHEVVSLLLRQALGCCEDEKTMSRSQVYSCNSERLL